MIWSSLSVLGLGLSVFIVLCLFSRWQPHWPLAFLVCLVLAGGVTHWIKFSMHAPRPAAVMAPGQLVIIGPTLKTHSMPSGHTVSAFACAAIILLSLRRGAPRQPRLPGMVRAGLTLSVLVVAVLIGLSRIAVGAHWPSDVVVGAGLGWACGALSLIAAERWVQHQRPVSAVIWWVLSGAQIVVGVVMLRIDTGFPLAHGLQWALGLASVASGLWHASAGLPGPAAAHPRTHHV